MFFLGGLRSIFFSSYSFQPVASNIVFFGSSASHEFMRPTRCSCAYMLNFVTNCYVQKEEQHRNSKMLDLLYVSCAHKLVPQILFYYHNYSHLPLQERPVLPIDHSARLVTVLVMVINQILVSFLIGSRACHVFSIGSDGMNGFLWSFERNVFRTVVSSPIRGFQDIECNQVL